MLPLIKDIICLYIYLFYGENFNIEWNLLLCPPPGQEFDVRAKCVINATGPFTDSLRKMDNQKTENICQPSAGVHIVIPGYYR